MIVSCLLYTSACGTECGVIYRTTGPMRTSEVVRLFELLEIVAETTVDDLRSLFISISDSAMDLSVECAADLLVVASPEVTVRREDGLWLVRTGIRAVSYTHLPVYLLCQPQGHPPDGGRQGAGRHLRGEVSRSRPVRADPQPVRLSLIHI